MNYMIVNADNQPVSFGNVSAMMDAYVAYKLNKEQFE